MTNPRKNDDLILSSKAFDYSEKVTIDPKDVNKAYSLLFMLLKKVTSKFFASSHLTYHKEHVRILLEIEVGFLQFKKINDYIDEANANLQKYIEAQKELDGIAEEIPEGPFGAGGDMVLVLLAPMLMENQDFVKIFNLCLELYEENVQAVLDSYQSYFEVGRSIERELPKTIEEIKKGLSAKGQTGSGHQMFIEQNFKDLDLLHARVLIKIQDTRSSVGSKIRHLKGLLEQAKGMNRL